MNASDPGALFAVKTNALAVVGQALDTTPWKAGKLGDFFTRRFAYHDRTPWDEAGQLTVYPSRAFLGGHGNEVVQPVGRWEGATGVHTVDLTIEAVTAITTQPTQFPPDPDRLQADTEFIDAVGWTMFVGLLAGVQSNVLTPLTGGGRVIVGPLAPGGARGGFAAVTCGLSLQL